jgi:hypothetical protein
MIIAHPGSSTTGSLYVDKNTGTCFVKAENDDVLLFYSVSDLHTLYADPDPAFLTHADPDPIPDPNPG